MFPGANVLVTRRCFERRLFLNPDAESAEKLHNFIGYVLGVTLERYGIELVAACYPGNHEHLNVTDPLGNLPDFKNTLHGWIARGVNALRGRFGTFWDAGESADSLPGDPVFDEEDLDSPDGDFDARVYTLCQASKHGLVPNGSRYAGFSTYGWGFNETRVFQRPDWFFDPKNSDLPDEVSITLTQLGDKRPDLDDEEFCEAMMARVRAQEVRNKDKMRKEGRRFLGGKKIGKRHWNRAPRSSEDKFVMLKRVRDRDGRKRRAALARHKDWRVCYPRQVRKLAPVLFLAAVSCGCSPSGADSGPTETDAPTGGQLDVPWEEQCEDATGVEFDFSEPAWQLDGPMQHSFQEGTSLLDGEASYLVARGPESEEVTVFLFDLFSGEVADSIVLPVLGVGHQWFRHPGGDALHVQSTGHRITVQRFSGLELVDETELADDHPRLGWDGGGSGVVMLDARADEFTVLGWSKGQVDSHSPKNVERVWQKVYSYGESAALATDFIWDVEDAQNTRAGEWIDGEAILARGTSIIRVAKDGTKVWGSSASVEGPPSRKGVWDGQMLWRHNQDSTLNSLGRVDVYSILDPVTPPVLQEVWSDKHCSARFAVWGGLVRGGQEVVLVAYDLDNDVNYIHRIARGSGQILETLRYDTAQGFGVSSVVPFDAPDDRIGLLFLGGQSGRARAKAYFPFEWSRPAAHGSVNGSHDAGASDRQTAPDPPGPTRYRG